MWNIIAVAYINRFQQIPTFLTRYFGRPDFPNAMGGFSHINYMRKTVGSVGNWAYYRQIRFAVEKIVAHYQRRPISLLFMTALRTEHPPAKAGGF
jgi:hypothetical protein